MQPSPFNPGDVLAGKYRVERVLGAGGMGVVLAARHLGLGQPVAIKLMLPAALAQDDLRQRFLREARAAALLRSQHVGKVLDVDTLDTGAPYMVMEYLDGTDLSSLLQRRGPLPVAEAVEYVLQACEAIAEAHAAGIVHRDLKPANLFLTSNPDGSPCVKVLDFGISKVTGGDHQVTKDGYVLGSPAYMSPEQMQAPASVDARSDLWAMGIVLYELLAGRPPFQGESLEALLVAVMFQAPPPLGSLRPDVPAGLEAVVFQCLAKPRTQRWPNIAAFAAALAPFASPRAAPYVGRVAAVLGVSGVASPATAKLPAPSAPALPTVAIAPATPQVTHGEHFTHAAPDPALPRSSRIWLVLACMAVMVLAAGAWAFIRARSDAMSTSTTPESPAAGSTTTATAVALSAGATSVAATPPAPPASVAAPTAPTQSAATLLPPHVPRPQPSAPSPPANLYKRK